MKAQILTFGEDADSTITNAQLRLELERSQAVSKRAQELQAQQFSEMEKLKVALANETTNVENERKAKQQAFKER